MLGPHELRVATVRWTSRPGSSPPEASSGVGPPHLHGSSGGGRPLRVPRPPPFPPPGPAESRREARSATATRGGGAHVHGTPFGEKVAQSPQSGARASNSPPPPAPGWRTGPPITACYVALRQRCNATGCFAALLQCNVTAVIRGPHGREPLHGACHHACSSRGGVMPRAGGLPAGSRASCPHVWPASRSIRRLWRRGRAASCGPAGHGPPAHPEIVT